MANGYMPRADEDALHFMQTFAKGLADNPSAYGEYGGEAKLVQTVVQDFSAAFLRSKNPTTRTTLAVGAKDIARWQAENVIARVYSRIKPNDGISDIEKLAIGVRPVNRTRRTIGCPQSQPVLSFAGATPLEHVLLYHDVNTPNSKRKPFGAIQLQLMVVISDTRKVSVNDARLYGCFTRNEMHVKFATGDEGKIATYFGRWVSQRGEFGPWSLPVSMRIAG